MKRFFTHPCAKYIMGEQIGFGWLERLSLLDLAAAMANRWHAHEEVEVICCLRGTLTYEFRDKPSITVPSGGLLVVPPRTAHRNAEGIDEPSRRISFFIRQRLPRHGRFSVFTVREFKALLAILMKRGLRPLKIPDAALAPLARLAECAARNGPTEMQERIAVRALTLFAFLSFIDDAQPVAIAQQTRLIDEAVRWLEEHYAEKISIPQLVAYMGYGCSRLCQLFKKHTGLSPIDWLTRYRISQAKKMLLEGRMSIGEIARGVGFHDAGFFSRVFKRRTGFTPLAYRLKVGR